MSRVFQPGTVQSAEGSTHQFYTEFALRYDTRLTRGDPPQEGTLEGYGGLARGRAMIRRATFASAGRAALYIPILRQYNILRPRSSSTGFAPAPDERPLQRARRPA